MPISSPLSPEDLERHARHIMLKEIGGPGLQRLKAASVSIVGAGALGGPCALFLAAAGVGRIEIWDDDVVERSNLQRQVQFSDADRGGSKAEMLGSRLKALDPSIELVIRRVRYSAGDVLSGDLLIDATDNYETRYGLNEAAHLSGRALVSGAAARWTGQVALFESGRTSGSPCYRCFVPDLPPDAEACDAVGVVGAVTGVIGARMALEAVKDITGAGSTLAGQLWIFDGLTGAARTLKVNQDPECQVCKT